MPCAPALSRTEFKPIDESAIVLEASHADGSRGAQEGTGDTSDGDEGFENTRAVGPGMHIYKASWRHAV